MKTSNPTHPLSSPKAHLKVVWITIISLMVAHAGLGQGVLLESDFESDTAGAQPAGNWTFSPSSNTADNGSVVVDGTTTPSNPLTGKSLYVYDLTSGSSTRVYQNLNDGVNVSAARVSFDFQRMFEDANPDTRVHFTIGQVNASLNNSDFRLFEVRMMNNGDFRVEYSRDGMGGDRGSAVVASYDTANPNTLVLFINSHGTETVDYDDGSLSGSLAPNMMDVYLNGISIGSYLTLKTPDPEGAPLVDFWASDADLGQVMFYQDTSRQGGIVFDNIVVTELAVGGSGGGPVDPILYIDNFDFESETVGQQPVMPFPASFSPGSNSSTNGFVVVDATSDPANPMDTGKALYAYDFHGDLSTGTSSRMQFDFAPTNTDNVRVDFDFQRMYAVAVEDEDTRIHVTVCPAGTSTNNSDFRPFEIRILNNGSLVVNYNPTGALEDGRESEVVASYDITGSNRLTFLANGNNGDALPYDDPELGMGEVPANAMVLFLNNIKVGEYGFINTPDPAAAAQIVFFETTQELGRFGIYQDSKRQGGIVFDNLSIQEFAKLGAPLAPSDLSATATGPESINLMWTDNSDNETGFVVEMLADAEWMEVEAIAADSTSYDVTGLSPETEYTFRVRSTNGTLSEPSNEAIATTEQQLTPLIQTDPQGDLLPSGSATTLAVVATGPGNLEYQWYVGQSGVTTDPIAGATESTYTTPELTATTDYWVRVTNTNGSADSVTATIEVFEPRTIRIVSIDQLNLLLPDALPGDTYVIDAGTYPNTQISFAPMGTPNAPVTLKAERPGEVIFTGNSYIRVGGDWNIVEGFLLTDGWNQSLDQAISFRTSSRQATNSRVTNCAIIDYSPPNPATDTDWVGMYGVNNRFDHNLLSGHSNKGVTLVVWRNPGKEDHHMIDHNHFRYRGNGGGENGWETIRIGTSGDSLSSSYCVVQYNLFEECDGEVEIISNKSGHNIYRYNTFWRSQGMLTLRHGDNCLIEGNIFLGEGVSNTGGIRVIGENHTIINNYIEGTTGRQDAAIPVYAGVPNSPLNRYFVADNAYIAHNTIVDVIGAHVLIGAGFGTSDRTVLPTGVVVENNLFAQRNTTSSTYKGPAADGEAVLDATYSGNIASSVFTGPPASGIDEISVPFTYGSFGLLRPESGSAVVDAAIGSTTELDLDGQTRDANPDVGADELVETPGVNEGGPIQPLQTGPDWREMVDTSPPWVGPALRAGRALQSSWFGTFYIGGNDWVYQPTIAWVYVGAISSTDSMWFWSDVLQSWTWTNKDYFPIFYDATREAWVYYVAAAGGGAYLFDYSQGAWTFVP
ncbi:MAG: chondroitinase-B domain-containing protein [Puniceicoccaceae bacterium]